MPDQSPVGLSEASGEHTEVRCSCGVPGCRELGWPHEWDPIAAGDSCTVTPPPGLMVAIIEDGGRYALVSCWHPPHKVREPYVRWGCGYSCVECVEVHGA
jgi:hypothetical protein